MIEAALVTRARPTIAILSLAIALNTAPAAGQTQHPAWASLSAGVSSYDLSGTGNAPVVAAGVSIDVAGPLVVEPALAFFHYSTLFSGSVTYLLPEVGVHFAPRIGPVRPMLGVGVGVSRVVQGFTSTDLAVHALLGIRAQVIESVEVRGQLRVREIDPWAATMADFMVGVGWRL